MHTHSVNCQVQDKSKEVPIRNWFPLCTCRLCVLNQEEEKKKTLKEELKAHQALWGKKKKLTMWACLCRMKEEAYGEEATLITLHHHHHHHHHAVSFFRNTHTHLHFPNLSEFYAFHFPPVSLSSWFEYLTWFLYYYYCILLHTHWSTLLLVLLLHLKLLLQRSLSL